jgi:two-component system, response regulator PdtaR
MESNGIVVFAKPVSGSLLYKVLTIFKAVDRRMSVVLEKNKKLEDKIEEIKLVSRAKMILMSKMGISEEEAHKHLDKTAKDQRKTKREIALAIIQMYE